MEVHQSGSTSYKGYGFFGRNNGTVKNLTLKGMSQKYYVNSAYLGQLFKKKYGVSFREYLNNCRIDEAARLLTTTNDKIYAIARAVGYQDLDYFIERFIAAKGCTPSSYRKTGG